MSAPAGGGGAYAQMPLQQLQQLVQQTQQSATSTLPPLGTFFTQAIGEFGKASASLRAEMDKTVPTWLDKAGQAHAAAGDAGNKAIQQNAQSIQETDPETLLQGVITAIGTAVQAVQQAVDKAKNSNALLLPEMAMQLPNPEAAAAMNALAQQMIAAAKAIQGAQPKNPWKVAPGGNGGSPSGGSQSDGGQSAGGQAGGAQSGGDQSGGDQAGADQAGAGQSGAPTGQDGAAGSDASMDGPSLQGTGTSVLPPPTVTPPPSVPVAASPQSGLGMPMMPISPVLPMGSGSVPGLVGGAKTSGGKFGGVPVGGVPGVGLAGSKSIPQAAHPSSQPAGGSVADDEPPEPPIIPPTAASSSSSGGGFGGMPMMPMTGGMAGGGGGGGGGTPGSGAVRRPPGGRGRGRTTPPGLPSQLQGKSGATEKESFAPLHRQSRRSSGADIDTLQILDEEMWQVDQPAGQALDRPADPPRRRAH